MCDTIVALGPATQDGSTLFGKNSDREPDEAQNIVIVPRRQYKSGETVKCTYISIPQAAETCRVLLSQPFWMFGAEMGANEFGVMIGNEAIFTREKPDKAGPNGDGPAAPGAGRGKYGQGGAGHHHRPAGETRAGRELRLPCIASTT